MTVVSDASNVDFLFSGQNTANLYTEASDLFFGTNSDNSGSDVGYHFLNGGNTEYETFDIAKQRVGIWDTSPEALI